MTADLTVITPSVPEREPMLLQNIASVRSQTVQPQRHLIAVDWAREGVVPTVNMLAAGVDTEWLVILADDDLLMKTYIEEMMSFVTSAVGVLYSRPAVVGSDWAPYRYEFSSEALRKANFIPATALIRTSLWKRLGGYSAEAFPEDWDFWLRALEAGAFFRHVNSRNWIYRHHDGQLFNKQPDVRGEGVGTEEQASGLQDAAVAADG